MLVHDASLSKGLPRYGGRFLLDRESLVFVLPVVLVAVGVAGFRFRWSVARTAAVGGLASAILIAVGYVFLPIPIDGWNRGSLDLGDSNLVPLRTIGQAIASDNGSGRDLRYAIGNVALFVPIGLLLPIVLPRLRGVASATAAALAAGVVAEGGQVLLGTIVGQYRTLDVDDLIERHRHDVGLGIVPVRGVFLRPSAEA